MEILNKVKEQLENKTYNYSFFQLYPFTTENINAYMKYFDLKDKSLLTVGSSSDQAINASIARCSDITICDICPLTKYFYFLKIAALLTLNRDTFLKFLCKETTNNEYNRQYLSKTIFNKIKNTLKSLDYESYYIWEYIFDNYNKSIIDRLFRNDINGLERIIYCNRYLKNDSTYNQARETIMNTSVSFKTADITQIKDDKSFDNIWLSNIAHYLISDEIDSMFKNCSKILNNNGKMLLCYFWNTSKTVKGFHINQLSKITSWHIIIPGTSKNDNKNSILIYK